MYSDFEEKLSIEITLNCGQELIPASFLPSSCSTQSNSLYRNLINKQFVYKFKNPDKAFCTMASLNSAAIADFQNYMGLFDYQKMRYDYLFLTTAIGESCTSYFFA